MSTLRLVGVSGPRGAWPRVLGGNVLVSPALSPLPPLSATGALHRPRGGPESHEGQCGGLQVHYPRFSGGLYHCCVLGERHIVNQHGK